jgi:hypothetical protein
MHSCDNPACVNVRHLSEGSHTLNQQDKVSKGRQAKGRKVGAAKLCELTVREIKFRYPNEPTEALAEEYGISRAHISRIATGGVWRHTGEPSLTERKMKRYEVSGEMLHVQEIARRYGLPETTVRGRIASGYTGEDLIRAKSSHTRRYR